MRRAERLRTTWRAVALRGRGTERSGGGWEDAPERSAPFSPLRRRLDNMALRWHARLDSPFADRSLPLILTGGLFLALAALSWARVRSYEPSESLARYTQATWQLHHSRGTSLTLVPAGVNGPQPLSALDGGLLFYPLGWLLGFLPIREALVVVQSAALALGVVPLWRLARRVANLRVGAATALVVAYGLFPPLHLMNIDGFEPMSLAVPLLLVVIHRAFSGSVIRFALAAVAVLACSAQLAIVLVGFGLLLALTVRRRAGTALAAVSAAVAVAGQWVSWLGAGDRVFLDANAYPAGTHSAVAVLVRAVAHPVASMSAIGDQRSLAIVAAILVPVALLPLVALRYLLPVLPLQIAYLLGALTDHQVLGPLAGAAIPFVFAAATFALARLGRSGSDRVAVPPRLSGTLIGVAVLFFLLDSASSPYQRPWQWGTRDALDGVRLRWSEEAIALPGEQLVAATSDMTPLLAGHHAVCPLPADRFRCPGTPTLYLVDRSLDRTTPLRADLDVVRTDGDGRFVELRPRP